MEASFKPANELAARYPSSTDHMLVAILSDVHANLPALERFVTATQGVAEAYVCLGDVVNYGPWNDECLDLLYSLPNIVVLEGNHERLFLGADQIADELPLVQAFYNHSIQHFTRSDLIAGLPLSREIGSFLCVHTIDSQKVYADTTIDVARNYMIGHTHHQFRIERSGQVIINCGSIGQNRGCIDVFSYVLYDTATDSATLHDGLYPVDQFIGELRVRGYPQQCIDYYLSKPRRATI